MSSESIWAALHVFRLLYVTPALGTRNVWLLWMRARGRASTLLCVYSVPLAELAQAAGPVDSWNSECPWNIYTCITCGNLLCQWMNTWAVALRFPMKSQCTTTFDTLERCATGQVETNSLSNSEDNAVDVDSPSSQRKCRCTRTSGTLKQSVITGSYRSLSALNTISMYRVCEYIRETCNKKS